MRVSLYAQISLKDRPPGFLGMTGEQLVIGKNEPTNLAPMIASILRRLADYYSIFVEPDELNEQLDMIAEYCRAARFSKEPDDEPAD